jgi:hypothetical protein
VEAGGRKVGDGERDLGTGARQAEAHVELGAAAGWDLQPEVRLTAMLPEAGDYGELVVGEGEGRWARSRHLVLQGGLAPADILAAARRSVVEKNAAEGAGESCRR